MTDFPEPHEWLNRTTAVLVDVQAERFRQVARYGQNEDLRDGTGPETRWLLPFTGHGAAAIELSLRNDYGEFEEEVGSVTWVHLLREEMAEAFVEVDPDRLYAEVIQLAALCVSWCEKLQPRRRAVDPQDFLPIGFMSDTGITKKED